MANGKWQKSPTFSSWFKIRVPVIRALQETDAAAIMIDHWVAAELAAFA